MKNKRLEIRIENEKKQQLEQIASKMNLKTSQLLSIIIDNYLNEADKNIRVYNAKKIALQFNKIYALVNQLDCYEFGKEILMEMGKLECLV